MRREEIPVTRTVLFVSVGFAMLDVVDEDYQVFEALKMKQNNTLLKP